MLHFACFFVKWSIIIYIFPNKTKKNIYCLAKSAYIKSIHSEVGGIKSINTNVGNFGYFPCNGALFGLVVNNDIISFTQTLNGAGVFTYMKTPKLPSFVGKWIIHRVAWYKLPTSTGSNFWNINCRCHMSQEPKTRPYFPSYWLFNRDPYHGLLGCPKKLVNG